MTVKLEKKKKDGKTVWSPVTPPLVGKRSLEKKTDEAGKSVWHVPALSNRAPIPFGDSDFKIGSKDQALISAWLEKHVYPAVIKKQKKSAQMHENVFAHASWECGYPYEGAIGGGLSYEFTPTSIGSCFIVRYGEEYELNLTDYDSW
jgi:hypothetical protein